jgi:hypothetical protein
MVQAALPLSPEPPLLQKPDAGPVSRVAKGSAGAGKTKRDGADLQSGFRDNWGCGLFSAGGSTHSGACAPSPRMAAPDDGAYSPCRKGQPTTPPGFFRWQSRWHNRFLKQSLSTSSAGWGRTTLASLTPIFPFGVRPASPTRFKLVKSELSSPPMLP